MTHESGSVVAAEPADLSGLFSRVGSELKSLADAVSDLQAFLTPLVADVVAREPHALTRLQDLDVMEQSLQGLSDLMACLDRSAALTDAKAVSRTVRAIRLAALANRLSSPQVDVAGISPASTLELF